MSGLNATNVNPAGALAGGVIEFIVLPIYPVLLALVIASMVGRKTWQSIFYCVAKRTLKDSKQVQHAKQQIPVAVLHVLMLITCLYQPLMCVAQGVTAITPDLFANKISQVIRNTMSYIDIALFVAMLNAFVLVWMLLTRAFDRVIIMRGKDISKKAAKNRKLILERLRRVAAVVLILASMGFSTIIVIGTILYVLGSTVRVIPQQNNTIAIVTIVLAIPTILSVGIIVLLLLVQYIMALQPQNALVEQARRKNSEAAKKRLKDQYAIMARVFIGACILLVSMLMRLGGAIVYAIIIILQQQTWAPLFLNLSDTLLLRGIASALQVAAMLVIFFPWPLHQRELTGAEGFRKLLAKLRASFTVVVDVQDEDEDTTSVASIKSTNGTSMSSARPSSRPTCSTVMSTNVVSSSMGIEDAAALSSQIALDLTSATTSSMSDQDSTTTASNIIVPSVIITESKDDAIIAEPGQGTSELPTENACEEDVACDV